MKILYIFRQVQQNQDNYADWLNLEEMVMKSYKLTWVGYIFYGLWKGRSKYWEKTDWDEGRMKHFEMTL